MYAHTYIHIYNMLFIYMYVCVCIKAWQNKCLCKASTEKPLKVFDMIAKSFNMDSHTLTATLTTVLYTS